jgi:type IV secretory pathway TrbL component
MNRAYVIAISFSALALFGFGPCSKLTGGDSQPAASASAAAASASASAAASAAAPAESASAAATDPSAAPDPTSVAPPPAPMASAKKETTKANYKAQLDQMEKELKK